jgi:hypothetical protein
MLCSNCSVAPLCSCFFIFFMQGIRMQSFQKVAHFFCSAGTEQFNIQIYDDARIPRERHVAFLEFKYGFNDLEIHVRSNGSDFTIDEPQQRARFQSIALSFEQQQCSADRSLAGVYWNCAVTPNTLCLPPSAWLSWTISKGASCISMRWPWDTRNFSHHDSTCFTRHHHSSNRCSDVFTPSLVFIGTTFSLKMTLQLYQKQAHEMFNLRSLLAGHVSCAIEMVCMRCNRRCAQVIHHDISGTRFYRRLGCPVRRVLKCMMVHCHKLTLSLFRGKCFGIPSSSGSCVDGRCSGTLFNPASSLGPGGAIVTIPQEFYFSIAHVNLCLPFFDHTFFMYAAIVLFVSVGLQFILWIFLQVMASRTSNSSTIGVQNEMVPCLNPMP